MPKQYNRPSVSKVHENSSHARDAQAQNKRERKKPEPTEQPRVVHISRAPAGSVYVGRPSPWGNPYIIGEDGTREEVVQKFAEWFLAQPDMVARAKRELKGKHLSCYCAPLPCHGSILLEVANT